MIGTILLAGTLLATGAAALSGNFLFAAVGAMVSVVIFLERIQRRWHRPEPTIMYKCENCGHTYKLVETHSKRV